MDDLVFCKNEAKKAEEVKNGCVSPPHGGDIYRNEVEMDFSVNINPFGMPERVRGALIESVGNCVHYPDMQADALRERLSEKLGVNKEEIVVGNGASALFMAIAQALQPKTVLIPVPSFGGYEYAAAATGSRIRYFYCKAEREFAPDEELCELTDGTEMLFIGHPANPTGKLLDTAFVGDLLDICGEKGIVTVLDESFIELCEGGDRKSCLQRARRDENVIVVRSFTKSYAIPGVRLGYLVCCRELGRRIEKQMPEWSVSVPALAAGCAAVWEEEYLKESTARLSVLRNDLAKELSSLGCRVYGSDADFILFECRLPLYEMLLREKILIRDCSSFPGLGKGFFRIAVRQKDENERLIGAMRRIMRGCTE